MGMLLLLRVVANSLVVSGGKMKNE
jgi:hypothetical protein